MSRTANKPAQAEMDEGIRAATGGPDLKAMEADMEKTFASMSFPGASRLNGDRQKITARREELLAERKDYEARQALIDSQHASYSRVISTNLKDIDATLALYPEQDAGNVVQLGAAE